MPEAALNSYDSSYHSPVMWREVVEIFSAAAGVVIDGTIGGGGHSQALLVSSADIRILGTDRDDEALEFSRERLSGFGDRIHFAKASFAELGEVIRDAQVIDWIATDRLVGALFDLGVSSHQLDDSRRGFSFRNAGPLDMRMDATSGTDLGGYLAGVDERELARSIAENGERHFARLLARKILAATRSGAVADTAALREIVVSALPKAYLAKRTDPATKVFQALRIAVNDELSQLDEVIAGLGEIFGVGARICFISYHSGEDQRVKRGFARLVEGGCTCPPALACVCGAQVTARSLGRLMRPKPDEIQANPRSRSARLRAIEFIEPVTVASLRGR